MLLAILAVLVVLVVTLLWTPIDLDLAAARDPTFTFRVHISWLFGLVTKELDGDEHERESDVRAVSSSRHARGGAGGTSKFSRVVRTRGFVGGVVRLIRRIMGGIELRRAELQGRAGFDDPADTGRFLGILYPITHFLGSALPFRIDVEPDFQREVFCFHARGVLRVVPSRVIGPALVFLLTPATLRALLAARA